ncbi:MAG: hypothetical protein OK474_08650 [Thaumarchaeota archaeon]|nr:hypothetical protein [Nitrososphaerota archaeon]
MLRFELHQPYLANISRYYLLLPKLTSGQLQVLADHLAGNGFSVEIEAEGEKLRAGNETSTITVSRSGLAWSGLEMLDALAPAIPRLLRLPREVTATNPYFAAKKLSGWLEVLFFTRMEGLRLWTELRRTGECGLTPDEKSAISWVLTNDDQDVECVTDYPTEGCSLLQVGKNQYYRSRVPVSEFLDHLRTTSARFSKNCYLPRTSILKIQGGSLAAPTIDVDLREWSYLRFSPKTSNSGA